MIYIYSLCQRILDIWLIKQGVTGFFIIFNTNTTLIDRPIDLSVLPTKLFDKINNSIYTTYPP